MKKFAFAVAALALTAGSAFAENPNNSIPAELQQNRTASQIDRSTTQSITRDRSTDTVRGTQRYVDPTANRYGDAQPRN